MTYFLRIMLVTAGIAGSATLAGATGTYNGGVMNGMTPQSLAVNALIDKSIGGNAITTNGASKAGEETVLGLFVIGVELPSR